MYKMMLLMLAVVLLFAGCGGSSSSSSDSQSSQKAWVRTHLDDVYLWYGEIVDVPRTNYATAPDYFNDLLVKSKDRFSFSMPQAAAVSSLQQGMDVGYGVLWRFTTTKQLYAYYVDPNSPAAASISRGTELTAINGTAISSLTDSYLGSALFPASNGTPVTLTYRAPGTSTIQTKSLVSATYSATMTSQPRIITLPSGVKAGYLLFNEHLPTAEQPLINAMTYFKQQGIGELVLDMRYNPGGYLLIAEELASMIGGGGVQGEVFERLVFNNKHPEKTNNPDNTLRFSPFDLNGSALPMLNLSRVFVLTGSSTCSASESVINGLLPFMQVIRVGWTTCGKPYGFIQTNYEQQAYFAIQFEGVNASGTGNYMYGFAPTCQVTDDINYQLGDSREARLSAALYYMTNNSCPTPVTVGLPKTASSGLVPISGEAQAVRQKPELKLF